MSIDKTKLGRSANPGDSAIRRTDDSNVRKTNWRAVTKSSTVTETGPATFSRTNTSIGARTNTGTEGSQAAISKSNPKSGSEQQLESVDPRAKKNPRLEHPRPARRIDPRPALKRDALVSDPLAHSLPSLPPVGNPMQPAPATPSLSSLSAPAFGLPFPSLYDNDAGCSGEEWSDQESLDSPTPSLGSSANFLPTGPSTTTSPSVLTATTTTTSASPAPPQPASAPAWNAPWEEIGTWLDAAAKKKPQKPEVLMNLLCDSLLEHLVHVPPMKPTVLRGQVQAGMGRLFRNYPDGRHDLAAIVDAAVELVLSTPEPPEKVRLSGKVFKPSAKKIGTEASNSVLIYESTDILSSQRIVVKTGKDLRARIDFKRELKLMETAARGGNDRIAEPLGMWKGSLLLAYKPGGDANTLIAALAKKARALGESKTQNVKFAQLLMLEDMIAGVQQCHANGVVHLDLRPGNFLVDERSMLLTDFGEARLSTELSSTAKMKKQAHYLSPGILQQADARIKDKERPIVFSKGDDLWALGVIAFEIFTGRGLFDGDAWSQVLAFGALDAKQRKDFLKKEGLADDGLCDLVLNLLDADKQGKDAAALLQEPAFTAMSEDQRKQARATICNLTAV
ncbi:MAG: protein kinase [Paucimonas sp.]|nr:protein kinase [Paucimonas sp.]